MSTTPRSAPRDIQIFSATDEAREIKTVCIDPDGFLDGDVSRMRALLRVCSALQTFCREHVATIENVWVGDARYSPLRFTQANAVQILEDILGLQIRAAYEDGKPTVLVPL